MNRIEATFRQLRADGGRGLMPFLCGGHPRPGVLGELLAGVERAGAHVAEVGIPFSDPIADGPVIAAAMHEALTAGSTPASVFNEVRACRPALRLPLVAMVSISIVHRSAGPRGFARAAADHGFDGLIVPDAPVEESEDLIAAARDAGLTLSFLIGPFTPPDRAVRIARACTGFVYLLARAGITGEREDAPDVADRVAELRRATDLPIACGFGISTPAHVAAVTAHADAAIVGSALVKRVARAGQDGRPPGAEAEAFVRELAAGLSGPRQR